VGRGNEEITENKKPTSDNALAGGGNEEITEN
jgi:hypothetical protein